MVPTHLSQICLLVQMNMWMNEWIQISTHLSQMCPLVQMNKWIKNWIQVSTYLLQRWPLVQMNKWIQDPTYLSQICPLVQMKGAFQLSILLLTSFHSPSVSRLTWGTKSNNCACKFRTQQRTLRTDQCHAALLTPLACTCEVPHHCVHLMDQEKRSYGGNTSKIYHRLILGWFIMKV